MVTKFSTSQESTVSYYPASLGPNSAVELFLMKPEMDANRSRFTMRMYFSKCYFSYGILQDHMVYRFGLSKY